MRKLHSNYTSFLFLLSPSSLEIPYEPLNLTVQGRLCDHGFGTLHWSMVASRTGSQLKAMTPLLERFVIQQSSRERGRDPWAHPHPQLPVHRASHAQFLVRVADLPEFRTAAAVSGPRWHFAHSPSYSAVLAFSPSGAPGVSWALFRAGHSSFLYSQHLGQLWGSTFTTVHSKEKLVIKTKYSICPWVWA